MANSENMKEVLFAGYCPKCKNSNKGNSEEPCDECVSIPMRQYSHKPEKFEEKEK